MNNTYASRNTSNKKNNQFFYKFNEMSYEYREDNKNDIEDERVRERVRRRGKLN